MTTGDAALALLVVALGAAGTFLMLPHRHGDARPRRLHAAGALCASLGLLLFLFFWKPPGEVISGFFFYVFGVGAIIGGVLTITSRNPVYSALWFALVVIATAGLFLLAGAQFLAAGTVIVYAGAIIVTFLFVIMLAQMQGRALYDRAARSPARATFTCYLLLWGLLYALLSARTVPTSEGPVDAMAVEKRLVRTEQLVAPDGVATRPHVRDLLRRAVRDTNRMSALVVEQEKSEPAQAGTIGDPIAKGRPVARERPKAHVAG